MAPLFASFNLRLIPTSECPLFSRKPSAASVLLNQGFRLAAEPFIVTIDADTIVTPQTVRHLIAPLADVSVDAVCGNVQVGNVRNLLTAFQDVEYVTSQNYDRRAFDSLNCISVVPGATGAWRRSSVLEVNGYSNETLTEDADLTVELSSGLASELTSRGARMRANQKPT